MQATMRKGTFQVQVRGIVALALLATQLVGCGWYLRPGRNCYSGPFGPGAYGNGSGYGQNGGGGYGPGGEWGDGAGKTRFDGEPKYMLDTVYFDFDQSYIREDQTAALERNLAWIRQNPNAPIRIEGHCDERGTEEYNLALGDRRADAVRSWMIDHGVDASRMQSVSKGEVEPADPGHDESAWAKNRRAEFLVLE